MTTSPESAQNNQGPGSNPAPADMPSAALGYAELGIEVFPLHTIAVIDGQAWCSCGDRWCDSRGKHPRNGRGHKEATTDEARIGAWWRQWPDANIGGRPGEYEFVADLDGEGAQQWLKEREPTMPATRIAKTGRGRHVWYRGSVPIVRNRTAPNALASGDGWAVEIKGRDGYLVLPPSLHESGRRYSWSRPPARYPVATNPLWLAELMGEQPSRNGRVAVDAVVDVIPEGARNSTLTSRAGAMRRAGFAESEILAALLAMNQRCAPPLPEADVLTIAQSVGRYDVPVVRESGKRVEPEGGEAVELAAIPDYPTEVLPRPMRALVATAKKAGLPPALAAGAALAAVATAIGPAASLEAQPGWAERAILWIPLLAPRGAGKSPCQELALRPLRDYDGQVWGPYRDELQAWVSGGRKDDKPVDPTILGADNTLEALARRLGDSESLGLDLDELSLLLRGLGEYKRGGGGDRGRFLSLWTGAPWRYTRVGINSRGANAIDILVTRPTLVVVGGLQPPLHHLLGGEEDGLRPRWLPHLAAMPDLDLGGSSSAPETWLRLFGADLLPARGRVREWELTPQARERFRRYRKHWKQQARAGESASTSAALVKADVHLLRILLAFAEADSPAKGGDVTPEQVERAVRVVDFTLDCWRALPESGGLALSRKDELLDRGVESLRDWLEQHGGRATRRDLGRAKVAGARTAADLDALLRRYEAVYPGTTRQEAPPTGGPEATVIYAPQRSLRVVDSRQRQESINPADEDGAEYETVSEEVPEPVAATVDNEVSTTVLSTTTDAFETVELDLDDIQSCPSCGQQAGYDEAAGQRTCAECGHQWAAP